MPEEPHNAQLGHLQARRWWRSGYPPTPCSSAATGVQRAVILASEGSQVRLEEGDVDRSGQMKDRAPGRWMHKVHKIAIVGPSYQGYVDAEAFRAGPLLLEPDGPAARALGPHDTSALVQLSAACPSQEWAESAIRPDHAPIFALERAGTLVAAASAPDDGQASPRWGSLPIPCIGVEDMGKRW